MLRTCRECGETYIETWDEESSALCAGCRTEAEAYSRQETEWEDEPWAS